MNKDLEEVGRMDEFEIPLVENFRRNINILPSKVGPSLQN